MKDYIFPVKKLTSRFRKINSIDTLKIFIQERSSHVTQTTLYGYIKTRIGSRYTLMFEDDIFVNSINIAKWNIYLVALADCTFYTFSYLVDKKNLKKIEADKVFFSIIENEKENGLSIKLFDQAKIDFQQRYKEIDWKNFHNKNPFKLSALALYRWAPISDELKILDKEIVLNSIDLKWNLVENEFKEMTKNLNFN
tara:strand:- start:276 stop:863 length:588 start_codon:yes stop_codon:yes gene_type:complete